MEKQFKVEGTDEGSICISVDGKPTTLSVNCDIQAEDIYNSLQYQPRYTYVFDDGGAGKVAQAPYEAFRDFLKEIVAQVNKLAENNDSGSDEIDAATHSVGAPTDGIPRDNEITF
mgnify:CR=1 FL=1|jgi:hypothetical protein